MFAGESKMINSGPVYRNWKVLGRIAFTHCRRQLKRGIFEKEGEEVGEGKEGGERGG